MFESHVHLSDAQPTVTVLWGNKFQKAAPPTLDLNLSTNYPNEKKEVPFIDCSKKILLIFAIEA